MRIFVLSPVLETSDESRKAARREAMRELAKVAGPDVELESRGLTVGSTSIECFSDEYVGMTDMVLKAVHAEREGFDSVVLNCFLNPALEGLREVLDVPVVGAGEAAVYVASMLGDNFTILDPDPPHRTYSHRMVHSLGLSHKLRSVRYLNLGVQGLYENFDEVLSKMFNEAVKAVEEDGAHVVVLGCTGMRRYAQKLKERMKSYEAPVIEPLETAVNLAALMVRLGLEQSRLTYPRPTRNHWR